MTGLLHSVLDGAGRQAAQIEQLWWLMLWVCTAVYLLVLAALAYAILRPRRGRAPPSEVLRPEPPVERRLARIVAGALVLTGAILFVFLGASFLTDRSLASLMGREQLTAQVTGRQWWWEIRFESGDPSLAFTTANELHLPVGVPVRIELTSDDVIHSFWFPSLHGKQDLVPGYQNAIFLQVDREGVYWGQCAEFCGLQHAHMGLVLVAEEPEEFAAWRERQLRPAAEPTTDGVRRGRDAFMSGACPLCHTVRGTPAAGTVAPDLTHFASRLTLAAGSRPNVRGWLAAWLADPQHVKPGNRMPLLGLEPEDLQALLDYLGSLE